MSCYIIRVVPVEQMPVGATLHYIQRENGEWDELKFMTMLFAYFPVTLADTRPETTTALK